MPNHTNLCQTIIIWKKKSESFQWRCLKQLAPLQCPAGKTKCHKSEFWCQNGWDLGFYQTGPTPNHGLGISWRKATQFSYSEQQKGIILPSLSLPRAFLFALVFETIIVQTHVGKGAQLYKHVSLQDVAIRGALGRSPPILFLRLSDSQMLSESR